MGTGLLLFPGNGEAPMNYRDNIYPFRQDSSFRYFAGINQPDLVLLIDADQGESTLYGTDISLDHIIWMGNQPSIRELANRSGIEKTGTPAQLAERLKNSKQQLHFLPPYREARKQQLRTWTGLDKTIIDAGSTPLSKAVISLRSIKEAQEIDEMIIAVNTSRKMHHAAMEHAQPGMKEAEVAGLIEGIAISGGGRLAYPAIVTRNGQILHNHYHGNTLEKGDLLLIDAGAESVSGYAGDITRTFCVGRELDQQQQAIYDIVLDAEESVIRDLKPGVPYRDYHLQACTIITKGLTDLGLMQGEPAEAVAAGAHALFLPHGLGHMIGMDVHDMEDLGEDLVGYDETYQRSTQFGTRALRLGRQLKAGFVLTVEPGIYFIPALIDQWQQTGKFKEFINYDRLRAYREFGGIRIEDNIAITENGAQVLGEAIRK